MANGRANTISQMKELIVQNYNHPCIVCWGVSNEITISTKNKQDMLDNHRELNELCNETVSYTHLSQDGAGGPDYLWDLDEAAIYYYPVPVRSPDHR